MDTKLVKFDTIGILMLLIIPCSVRECHSLYQYSFYNGHGFKQNKVWKKLKVKLQNY